MSQTTTKKCLDCATQIPYTAAKCPNCGEWQESKARLQKHQERMNKNFDLHKSQSAISLLSRYGKPAMVLLAILSALGLLALAYGTYVNK